MTDETRHCPDCFEIVVACDPAREGFVFCPKCKLDVPAKIALDNACKTAPRRRRWLWASGQLHDEPPPSTETLVVSCVILEEGQTAVHIPPPLPEVVDDFHFTERTRLRVQALDFVLRAAAIGGRPVSGQELQREAEGLEKWIACVGPV